MLSLAQPSGKSPSLRQLWRVAGAIALAVAAPADGGAQVTATVAAEARAYDDLARLKALGLIDRYPTGLHPLTRRHIQLLVDAAEVSLGRARLDTVRHELAEELIAGLRARLSLPDPASATRRAASIAGRFDAATLGVVWADSPDRSIVGPGMTAMDALVNPLLNGRGGRRYAHGTTAELELAASAEIGRHLAVVARPRLAHLDPSLGTGSTQTEWRELNVSAGMGNTRLTVGRSALRVGQGLAGGLFASHNSPALDMVQLRTEMPGALPGALRRLGPMHGMVFLADLGPDQHFPHARLAGWKVAALPTSDLEIGVSVLVETGGEGAPTAGLGERIVDLFPIIDVLLYQDRDLLFSNKLAGMDVRWGLPGSGVELYADAMFDDFDIRRIRSSLWEDAGLLAGISLPAAGPEARLRLDAEYQHTGLRFYEHGQFRSGVTFRQTIIGIPLGPRGSAAIARAAWRARSGGQFGVTLATESRSDDQYTTRVNGPDDSGWRFVKTEDRPEERRSRLLLQWETPSSDAWRLQVEAGIEHSLNHGFVDGARRTNLLLGASLASGF